MAETSNTSITDTSQPRTIAYLSEEINPNKTATVRPLSRVDVEGLKHALGELPRSAWDKPSDFEANYNKQGAIRSAEHIIFRFCDRRQSPYRYFDMPMWSEWEARIQPLMDVAVAPYAYKRGFFPRIMLAKLPGGTFIPPHIDGEARVSIPHKIHIPIITNPKTYFFVNDERFHFEEGTAYEVNNGTRHAVTNSGDSDRIHLIFEYLDADLQPFDR